MGWSEVPFKHRSKCEGVDHEDSGQREGRTQRPSGRCKLSLL